MKGNFISNTGKKERRGCRLRSEKGRGQRPKRNVARKGDSSGACIGSTCRSKGGRCLLLKKKEGGVHSRLRKERDRGRKRIRFFSATTPPNDCLRKREAGMAHINLLRKERRARSTWSTRGLIVLLQKKLGLGKGN